MRLSELAKSVLPFIEACWKRCREIGSLSYLNRGYLFFGFDGGESGAIGLSRQTAQCGSPDSFH
jgi:hypothetical protein